VASGFSLYTIRDWRYQDPEFMADWEAARVVLIERVEHSLYEQAIGVETTSETSEIVDGEEGPELKVVKRVVKTERSVQAASLWLRGNDPARYRDSNHVQPPDPRRPVDEELMKKIMSDPALSAALDEIYDADLN